jgi:hypothetical protein
MAADTLAQFIRQIDAGNRLGAGALAEKIVEWMATQAPAPAHGDSLAIERDEQMDRDYIPLPGGWELQTKGKGSTLRLLDKKTGERNPLPLPDFIVEFIERMAREVNAASNVQPKGTVPGWVIEAMQEALSVCDSVSMSRDRRVVRDGCVLYLQTEEWCQWAEQEVAPKMRAALAAVQHAAEATAQAPAPEHGPSLPSGWRVQRNEDGSIGLFAPPPVDGESRRTSELFTGKLGSDMNEIVFKLLTHMLDATQAPAAGPDDARDAARYRFIRDADRSDEALDCGSLMELAMESMDAAIDEAMAREAASKPPVQGSQP